jgi:phenol hydroxylase P5 protein
LKVGDTVDLSGRTASFWRTSQSGDLIFIAGGSGLSSPQSMILDLLEAGDSRQIVLFQGAQPCRTLQPRTVRGAGPGARQLHLCAGAQPGGRGFRLDGVQGYVHDAAKQHFDGRFNNRKAYLCGPPVMIDSAITCLMQGRLFERDIFMERFYSAADGSEQTQRSALFKRI